VSHDCLGPFDLVDTDGIVCEEWAPDDTDFRRPRLYGDDDAAATLLAGDWIGLDDRTVSLEPRSPRDPP